MPATTVGAKRDVVGGSLDIGNSCSFFGDAEGVWFLVLGNGKFYTASTCTGDVFLDDTGFESQINVYSGNSCDALTCVAGNEDNNVNRMCNAGASWFATSNETYWIRVFGHNSTGSFAVSVNPTPPNDVCEGALPLQFNETMAGTTLGATLGVEQSVCGGAVENEGVPGVWYSLVGVDGVLTVTTCTGNSTLDETGFDSQIVVYSGKCGNLTCVNGNDDVSFDLCQGFNAGVSWNSVAGTIYYVKVYGYSAVGSFGLTAYIGGPNGSMVDPSAPTPVPAFSSYSGPPVPAPLNDLCENVPLITSGELVVGTVFGSTNEGFNGDVCGEIDYEYYGGVYYEFVGTGRVHTVTTCTGVDALDNAGFNSQLLLYSGTCDANVTNLTCMDGNLNYFEGCRGYNAAIAFQSQPNVSYFIRVSGDYDDGMADFGLRVDEGDTRIVAPVPENDACQNATELQLGTIVEGTTLGATALPYGSLSFCGDAVDTFSATPEVWYSLVGTGELLTVSTCTESALDSNFDTQIVIYTGDCDGELQCITGNDDDARDSCVRFNAGASFQSEAGVRYLIRVFGYSTAGNFGIQAYEGLPVTSSP